MAPIPRQGRPGHLHGRLGQQPLIGCYSDGIDLIEAPEPELFDAQGGAEPSERRAGLTQAATDRLSRYELFRGDGVVRGEVEPGRPEDENLSRRFGFEGGVLKRLLQNSAV
jgi:hypothetical protein